MPWHRYPDVLIPREQKRVWMFDNMDGGAFLATRGTGAGEWWNQSGQRVWAPTHWMPFTPPEPPEK